MPEDVKQPAAADASAPKTETPAPAADAPAKPAAPPVQTDAAKANPDAKPAAPAASRSILDDADGDDDADPADGAPAEAKQVVPANWPEDWRTKLASGDDKLLKRLERFSDPNAMLKSWLAAEQKIKSGEYKQAQLPDDATPEQVAEWRKNQGIPEKAGEYELPVVPGHQWTDADKPALEQVFDVMHAANVPATAAKSVLEWYGKAQLAAAEHKAQTDAADKATAEDALRADLGAEYRPTMKLMRRLFDDAEWMPQTASARLLEARTPDGHRIINDPAVARMLIDIAKERYGDTPMLVGDTGRTVSSRIDEIKAVRDANINEYYEKGLDKELLELQRKMGGRRAA